MILMEKVKLKSKSLLYKGRDFICDFKLKIYCIKVPAGNIFFTYLFFEINYCISLNLLQANYPKL